MKQLSIRAFFSLLVFMSLSCMAQEFVVVVKPNVNARQAPNTSAEIITKVPLGTVFEVVSKQVGWYEVKEAWTEKIVFISANLVKPTKNMTDEIVGLTEHGGYQYENVVENKKGAITTNYSLWQKEKNSKVVYSLQTITTVEMTGRMRTYETYYKGKQMGWYIVLTEETDSEGVIQTQLEQPILIFKEHTGKSGIYIQGTYYIEAGNPFG